MYFVRQDLMLQSVFRDKERLTLIQFSSLKTQVVSAFPKILFFFCVQFCNHAPDMSVECVSFPFLFGGFHSFVFRCFFSLLVLREIVLLMVFCHMSCLSADEAFSIFHQLVPFVNAQGVNIHSVGILLSSEESSVRGSGFSLTLVRVVPSHNPHHPPPLVVELSSPFIPIVQFLWGDSRVRIRFCKGIDNVSRKRSIITGDDLSNFDSDTIILNLAMCSSIESSLFIRNVFIFSRASPGES